MIKKKLHRAWSSNLLNCPWMLPWILRTLPVMKSSSFFCSIAISSCFSCLVSKQVCNHSWSVPCSQNQSYFNTQLLFLRVHGHVKCGMCELSFGMASCLMWIINETCTNHNDSLITCHIISFIMEGWFYKTVKQATRTNLLFDTNIKGETQKVLLKYENNETPSYEAKQRS